MLNNRSAIFCLLLAFQTSAFAAANSPTPKSEDLAINPIALTLKAGNLVNCKVFRKGKDSEKVYYDLEGRVVRRIDRTLIISGVEPRLNRLAYMKVDDKACVTNKYRIDKNFEIVEISQVELDQKAEDARKKYISDQITIAIDEANKTAATEVYVEEETPVSVDLRDKAQTTPDKKKNSGERSFSSVIDEGVARFNEVSNHDSSRLKKKIEKKLDSKEELPPAQEVTETSPQKKASKASPVVKKEVPQSKVVTSKKAPEKSAPKEEKKSSAGFFQRFFGRN